ncbi:MAG: carbonic anhydrase [Sphingopyxis sp.]|nr:carbonic anhydrase [Sphingopyxis sp.]
MASVPQADGKTLLTPNQALERLQEGNRRFAADQPTQPDISVKRRAAIAASQAPFAVILCCSDSRVGPEQLFGAGLGELFVVRTAGNYLDTAGIGSVEFGVSVLGAPLVVVLGHERCGAVKAAAAVLKDNVALPGSLGPLVEPIIPSVIDAKANLKPGDDLIETAARIHAKRVAKRLKNTPDPAFAAPSSAGKLNVVAAYYDLDTGLVEILDV